MPNVTIDGRTVEVEKGATVLDAANKAGVWIPTLCFHPALPSPGSCRVCTVELDRGQWTQLITSCNYPVRQDIKVSVSSPAAVRARQGVMHFLLARAPGNKALVALAEKMGIHGTPYPTVTKSQRDCILCGLCTAVCEEQIGKAAIAFSGRGTDRVVSTPFRLPSEDCIGCGACAAVCPVGTIQVRLHEDTGEVEISPFKTRVKLRACSECGQRITSAPVTEEALKRLSGHGDELRLRLDLCPRCRRKKTVLSAHVPAGSQTRNK
jgi:NADH dehydrogenase/NADH:ubiquinone oxidoreductase subunit G